MKKISLALVLLGFCMIVMGQVKFQWSNFDHAWVSGTASDTSSTFNSKPIMSFKIWASDTLNADSVNVEFFIDMSVIPDSSDWTVIDSLTITTDSVWTDWMITEFAIPSNPFYRIRKTGRAGNTIASSVETKVRESLADDRR